MTCMNKQHGFGLIGIVVIVAVVAVGVGGYIYLNNDSDQKQTSSTPSEFPTVTPTRTPTPTSTVTNTTTPKATAIPTAISRFEIDNGRKVGSPEYATIKVYSQNNILLETIVVRAGGYINTLAKVSPDEKSLFYMWGMDDSGSGAIYSAKDDTIHNISFGIGTIKPIEWMADGRLDFWYGCVIADPCVHYRSTNSATPWVVQKVN